MSALEKVVAARTRLLMDQPFWGVLALRLRLVEDPTCGTAWTNGVEMGFNPKFIEALTPKQLDGLIAHEVGHCIFGHPWRRETRDPLTWNKACDYVLNPALIDDGYALPEGALLRQDFHGRSAEWVYPRLVEEEQDDAEQDDEHGGAGDDEGQDEDGHGPGGDGPGPKAGSKAPEPGAGQPPQQGGQDGPQGPQGQPQRDNGGTGPKSPEGASGAPGEGPEPAPQNGSQTSPQGPREPGEYGEVRDAPRESQGQGQGQGDSVPTESDWRQAALEAAKAAGMRGELSGGAKRVVEELGESGVDWKAVLQRFLVERARSDYSWVRPNGRYLSSGMYMPSLNVPEAGVLVFAIDTSASIDRVMLQQFETEVQAAVDQVKPREVVVMYCDAEVKRTDVFYPNDEIKFEAVGGGGTNFIPVFTAVDKLDEEPAALVYLTDLDGSFPVAEPAYPTLWVVARGPYTYTHRTEAPFGEVVIVR